MKHLLVCQKIISTNTLWYKQHNINYDEKLNVQVSGDQTVSLDSMAARHNDQENSLCPNKMGDVTWTSSGDDEDKENP